MRRNRRTGFTLVELPAVSKRKRGAFTLVELLVVIGIIALLISILLPAMAAARRQAMKTKCAAQMRDVGNAMLMYAQDNKGYLPAVRLSNSYTIDYGYYSMTYAMTPAENTVPPNLSVKEYIKWWCFLGKYVSKNKPMAQTPDEMNQQMRGVFWCPAFAGYTEGGNTYDVLNGVNRNLPGIGMNWFPDATPASPQPLSTYTPSSNPHDRFSDCTSAASKAGTWYKLSQYTQASQRALLADSRQFYLEAGYLAPGSTIPGQRLNYSSNDYSSSSTLGGQTAYDFYRHGIYPPVQDPTPATGTYSPTGGKIGYNILFADNHVESPTDRETGYRACRMIFPG